MPFITKGKTNWKYLLIIAIVAAMADGVILAYKYYWPLGSESVPPSIQQLFDETVDWSTYTNNQYGFEVTLLDSWKGYSILEETWQGVTLDGKDTKYKGPQIVIRHPEWTLDQPWQDIPVMIFTNEEWELVEDNNLNVSAAPVGPTKLDQNENYVFALPPRWIGFTDNPGQDEAREIVKTFEALTTAAAADDDDVTDTTDWQIYKSEDYGFEIEYPSNLSFQEKQDDLFEAEFPDLGLKLILDKKPENFSNLENYLTTLANKKNNDYDPEGFYTPYVVRSKDFGDKKTFVLFWYAIGGNAAAMGYTSEEVYFENDNYFFIASYDYSIIQIEGEEVSSFGPEPLKRYNTIQKILSTFRFIEIDKTADWQIYKSEDYGFEIKYPEDWPVEESNIIITDCNYTNFPEKCPNIIEQQEIAEGNPYVPPYWLKAEGEKITINNIPFCLNETSDAAMGHWSEDKYYTTVKNNKCLTINLFTIYTKCQWGYDLESEEYKECEEINKLKRETINKIISTFKFID